MGFFSRLGDIFKANANDVLDNFEDVSKMAKQGIRDLKEQLGVATTNLAAAKANTIKAKREYEHSLKNVETYERNAMDLLKKAENGDITQAEGDRLATLALSKKEGFEKEAVHRKTLWEKRKESSDKFEAQVAKLKKEIENWETEARCLETRKQLADNEIALNKQMSSISTSSTTDMLKRVKEKVEQAEDTAKAEEQINSGYTSADDEINAALATPADTSNALAALKEKMKTQKAVSSE